MPPQAVINNPRLDYFNKPPLNVTNQAYSLQVIDPASTPVQDGPITFNVTSDNAFLNFEESILRFKLRVVLPDGENLAQAMDNHVAFVPNIFHSIFTQIRVRVNGHRVSPSNDLYSYKAYIDELLDQTKDGAYLNELSGGLYDAGGEDAVGEDNPNWALRAAKCNRSALAEYSGQLRLDFLNGSRNIIPASRISIELFPQYPRFVIQRDDNPAVENVNFKFEITEPQLIVRREEIAPEVAMAIETRLAKQMINYYYDLGCVIPFNIRHGTYTFKCDNIFNSQFPKKVIVAFTRSTAFNGTYDTSPFYFNPTEHLEQVEFFKNGVRTGLQRAFSIDLAEGGTDKHMAYRELHKAVNGVNTKAGLPFSLAAFRQGYFLTGIDLTPDGRDDLAHHYPTDTSTFSISVKFRQPPANDLEMLVYGVFSETLSMNQSRQVVTTLNI